MGRPMKIKTTDPLFQPTALQQSTVYNWASRVSDTSHLDMCIKASFAKWFSNPNNNFENLHFTVDAPNPRLISLLLADVLELLPDAYARLEYKQSDRFVFNDASLTDLFESSSVSMGARNAVLPLLLIGTHRVFVRRMIGTMWSQDWNISIAGCVSTCVSLGIAVSSD